jgi:hypothetical protein
MNMSPVKHEKAKPFLRGLASAFDMTGRTFMQKDENAMNGFQKDYLAMRRDWENLGNDFRKSVGIVIRAK